MTRELFEEQQFLSLLFQVRDVFTSFFQEQEPSYWNKGRTGFSEFLQDLAKGQEENTFPLVESIHISLLYSSFWEETLVFQVDAYGAEGSVVGEVVHGCQINMGSLKKPLEEILEHWVLWTEEQLVHGIITPVYLKFLVNRCLSPVFRHFVSKYRYEWKESFETPSMESLGKTDRFFVNLGELGGWGEMVYGLRKNVDLLIDSKETYWKFAQIEDKTYENEVFDQRTIPWGVFRGCVFDHCEISQFSLTDCIFQDCTFHHVTFTSGFIQGSQFISCIFLQTTFDGVNFYQTDLEQEQSLDRYRPCGFHACHINGCHFRLCHLAEVTLTDCHSENYSTELTVVRDSDFQEKGGV